MNSRELYVVKQRCFANVNLAYQKLPTNLKILADVVLDSIHPEEDRIDFMYSLARNSHPAIMSIIENLANANYGKLSLEAQKILLNYSPGLPQKSYSNISEALSELSAKERAIANKLLHHDYQDMAELRSAATYLIKTHNPAAIHILEHIGLIATRNI